MSSIWDDPNLKVNDNYVKFEQPGDTVSGTILAIRPHQFDDGKYVPQIVLDTGPGEEQTVTAGQVRLKAALAEQRPEAGDRITITLTGIEPRAGGKSLKLFDLKVERGNRTNGQAAAAAATSPAPVPAEPAAAPEPDPSAVATALASLTDEQKKALGIAT